MKYPEDFINKIICGDSLDIMKQIPDKSVDLVLTDPPYGIGMRYDLYDDTEENLKNLITHFIPEVLRIGKRIAIFTGVQNIWKYPMADWIISYTWNTTGSYGKLGYNQWQPIIFYGKDMKGFGSINGQLKSDVIRFSGMGSAEYSKQDHPCPKPEGVIKKLIARFSEEKDIVLDCFNGAGSTSYCAKKIGRKFIGIEISPEYCKIAEDRLRQEVLPF